MQPPMQAPMPPQPPAYGAPMPQAQPQAAAYAPQNAYGQGAAPFYGAPPGYGGAPQAPQAPQHFGAGARVMVQWADGNRYPGVVQSQNGVHYLVAFPDGRTQWVEAQYLSTGI
jgi:hypothetical protein